MVREYRWVSQQPEIAGVDVVGTVDAVFDEVFGQVAGRFPRFESRRQARLYARGLASGVARKNSWELAEQAGDGTPDRMQKLLNVAAWDDAGVRVDLRRLAADRFGGSQGVLIVDDTGFLKKGSRSAGVQRQYSGTAGRIENCQIGTFLAYAGRRGRALIDVELYLPASWIADRARCQDAGIGDDVQFVTKPEQARMMIERAIAEGIGFGWVAADEAYGDNGPLRAWLDGQDLHYVMAVARDHQVPAMTGPVRVDVLAAQVPADGWGRYSAGDGAKGERYYDWAQITTTDPRHRVLIRRNITTGELAFYHARTPEQAALPELVRVAGTRWAIEELFQAAKGQVGLDHYQVRRYRPWYRHMTLAMLTLTWLALTAEALHRGHQHLWTTTTNPATKYTP